MLMAHDTVQGKLFYVARFAGCTVVFQSYWISGTYGLGADALFALNRAGAAATLSDWDAIVIDGPFRTRWSAKRSAKAPNGAGAEPEVMENDAGDVSEGESSASEPPINTERPGFIDVDYSQPDDFAVVFEQAANDADESESVSLIVAEGNDPNSGDADNGDDEGDAEEPEEPEEPEGRPSIESLKQRLVRKWSKNQNGTLGV